jgi:carbon storage regulator
MKSITIERKVNQEIVIGDGIRVTVVEIISSKKVRLGVSAPRDLNVYRKELVENIVSQEMPATTRNNIA